MKVFVKSREASLDEALQQKRQILRLLKIVNNLFERLDSLVPQNTVCCSLKGMLHITIISRISIKDLRNWYQKNIIKSTQNMRFVMSSIGCLYVLT